MEISIFITSTTTVIDAMLYSCFLVS